MPVRLGSPLVWTEGVHSLDVDPSPPIPRPTTKIWDQSATKGWQLHIYAKIIDIRVNKYQLLNADTYVRNIHIFVIRVRQTL